MAAVRTKKRQTRQMHVSFKHDQPNAQNFECPLEIFEKKTNTSTKFVY